MEFCADDISGFRVGWGGSVTPHADEGGEAVASLVEVPRPPISRGRAGGAADLRGPARFYNFRSHSFGSKIDPKMSAQQIRLKY